MLQELSVDLRRPPSDRWHLTPVQCQQARELLSQYRTDLGLPRDSAELLTAAARNVVREEHWLEMEALARAASVPTSDVILGHLYYDAIKASLCDVFGCTAFAVQTPAGMLHARNLDWWTDNAALARYTGVNHFTGGSAGPFTTIGWPGFAGAFSGIAPGRFAITLNAVLSLEPPQLAMPVVFLLRTVLEEATTYQEALRLLSETPIPCDCLLLLSGTVPGELAVIERTPTRYSLRGPKAGNVCVTNGYLSLDAGLGNTPSGVLATSCQRFNRIQALIADRPPVNAEDCLDYLSDPEVRMNMTVQQMVFVAATGKYWTRTPGSPPPRHNPIDLH